MFFWRVFRTFASLTSRSVSSANHDEIDYACDILHSTHSRFDFAQLQGQPWFGLHVIRDPRDLAVSAAHYHQHSQEPWLHIPREKFGGRTYQQALSALASFEDKLLFELQNSTHRNIQDMVGWNYAMRPMAELRYERLVGVEGPAYFAEHISRWPLEPKEAADLVRIFRFFALGAPGSQNAVHIRNPAPEQWREHFTPAVTERFNAIFPGVLERLGYRAF